MGHTADRKWTPVALSHDLHCGEVRPAFTPSLSIALWRDFNGTAHATHTRCPHRGMNLVYGFVRDQNLACAYHGWQYDAAGQCVYIPAHPELPPARSICATVFGCVESGGVVFVCKDPGATEMPTAPERPQSGVRTVTIDNAVDAVSTELGGHRDDLWIKPSQIDNVVCTLQALPDSRCAMHVLLSGATATVESKLAAARWACQLRDTCEQQSRRDL